MKCLPHSCQAISRMWGQPCYVPSMPMHFFRSSIRVYARWCDPEQGWSTPCTSDFSLLLLDMDMGTWEDFWAVKRGSWKNEVGTGSLTQAFMVLEVLSVFWAAILCCLVQESTLGKHRQKMMTELSTGSYEEGARWRRGEESHQASALTCQMLRTIRNTDCWSSKGSGLRTGFQSPHCWGETESPLHAAHSSSAATAVLQRSFQGQALGVWLHDMFKLSMPKAIVPELHSSRPGCCEANYHTQSPCPSPHSTTSAKTHILRCFTFRSNLPFLWIKKQHLWSNN